MSRPSPRKALGKAVFEQCCTPNHHSFVSPRQPNVIHRRIGFKCLRVGWQWVKEPQSQKWNLTTVSLKIGHNIISGAITVY